MRFATLFVSALIVIAVLLPGGNIPSVSIVGFDKVVHFAMFATWAVAVYYDFSHKSFLFVKVFCAGLMFSILTEVLQLLVEGRTFDFRDVAADVLGLAAGLAVSPTVVRWFSKFK